MQRIGAAVVICLALCAGQAIGAVKALTGIELARFSGRDVLVLRTTGDIAVPSGYQRDSGKSQVAFLLNGADSGGVEKAAAQLSSQLLRTVKLAPVAEGVQVTLTLASGELTDPAYFRFSSPSRHVIVFEVFPLKEQREDAAPLLDRDLDKWLRGAPAPAADPKPAAKAAPAKPVAGGKPAPPRPVADDGFAQQRGIPSLDLRQSDPQRVLGLAADSGLLNLRGNASVSTEGIGSIAVKPSGQSLSSWSGATPPGEIYLAGSPAQIAEFMQYADPRFVDAQPSLADEWAKARPQADNKPVLGGRSAATRMRLKDDPAGGLYYSDYMPGGVQLSDVLVTLDASGGLNLYDVLDYLSEISGISLLIDPYAFDDPTGSKRDPLPPGGESSDPRDPGFRPAGVFGGTGFRPGTVRGNFVNVPFDEFLQMILSTHELVFTVRGGGSTDSGYGDGSRGPGGGTTGGDPYQKPVVLVTSPERLNYELDGTNDIALTQFHYADPDQVAQLLQQFGVVPDINAGWFIYRGGGGGSGLGQGGNGGGGNGNLGGNRGGGSGGNGRGGLASAKPDVLVYRGSSRAPVEQAVDAALAAGQSVVRVTLAPERSGQLVTLFATSSRKR
jgi:hypothetical protein